MTISVQTDQEALWKRRYRLPITYGAQIARLDPTRGVTLTTYRGVDQLEAWQVRTGALTPITHHSEGSGDTTDNIPSACLSPHGTFIYYFKDEGGSEIGHFVRVPYTGGAAEVLTPDIPPYSGFFFGISATGNRCGFTAQRDDGFTICVLDVHADGSLGQPTTLYQSTNQAQGPLFSYDGSVAVIATKDAGASDFHFISLDVATGREIASLTAEQGGLELALASPLPDDLHFLARSSRTDSWQPFLWNALTGKRIELDLGELEGDLVPLDWAAGVAGSSQILLRQEVHVTQRLWLYDVEQRALRQLDELESGTYGSSEPRSVFFGPDGAIYALWENSVQPLQLVALDRDSGRRMDVVLSAGAPLEGHSWKSVTFPSADGQPVQGWLALPSGAGPFPCIIEAHGGPEFAITDMFSPPSQSWLDHGFAYLTVNYRGSTGFGKAFQEQIRGHLGYWEVEDLVAARRWLVKQGVADPRKVMLTGWSWGGYLTLQALGTHPGLWAGGMAGIAISDLVLNDATSIIRDYIRSLMGGTPAELPEQYRASSPVTYVGQVDAPLFIIQGRNDARCPAEQIEVYKRQMRALGKEIEVLWFDAGHAGVDTEERIAQQEQLLRFAARVLNAIDGGLD